MTSSSEGRSPHRTGPADQLASKLTDRPNSTAPRLTVNSCELLMLEAELAEILGHPVAMADAQEADEPTVAGPRAGISTQAALTDTTRVAQVLMESFGPAWCRHLAAELEQVRPVVVSDG